MKVTMLGCGALGQLWLSALVEAKHDVQGWRKENASTLQFSVQTVTGSITNYHLKANDLDHLKGSDLLIVALKAGSIAEALPQLAVFLPPHSGIILMHNGMGVLKTLPPLKQPLLRAVTTQAAKITTDGCQHTGLGTTQLGPISSNAEPLSHLATILDQALPETFWCKDIESAAWNKLLVNCLINPLTVKYQCNNGKLITHIDEINQLALELSWCSTALAIPYDRHRILHQTLQVIKATAKNTSSMLQDIQQGRPTEIDFITGFLLQQAKSQGLILHTHQKLYELVKDKEASYG